MATCRLNKILGAEKIGHGHNLFVAVGKYNYNQEDGIVGNQFTLDLGLFGTSYYKMYSDNEKIDTETGEEHHFYNPLFKDEMTQYPNEDDLKTNNRDNYNSIDKYGLPKKGTYIEENDIVIGKYMKGKNDSGQDVYKDMSTKVKMGNEGSMIDRVYTFQTNPDGDRTTKIRTCQFRPPIMGDKFASRNGQKGTFSMVLQKEDLPYTEDGITPDIILDPSSYPSRMTGTQFIEMLFGTMAAELGFQGVFTPFETVNIEQINDILETKLGLSSMGERVLYNGMTGKQMEVTIFTGVIYYQRLRYMVNDKINTRLSGERQNGIPKPGGLYTVNRQSVAGRANRGGLRFGEMERDALISHGIWSFIKESYIDRGDKFIIQVSKASGEITVSNPDKNLYYDNITDGIISYQLDDSIGQKNSKNMNINKDKIIGVNMFDQKTVNFINLVVPYTFKILLQEMQGMMMSVKMSVDKLKQFTEMYEESDKIIELDEEDIDELIYDTAFEKSRAKTQDNDEQDLENPARKYSTNVENEDEENEDEEEEDSNEVMNNNQNGGYSQDEDDSENKNDEDNDNDSIDGGDSDDNDQDLENPERKYNSNDDDDDEENSNSNMSGGNQPFQRANLNPDIKFNTMNSNTMSGGNMMNQQHSMNNNNNNDNNYSNYDSNNDSSDDSEKFKQYGGVKPDFNIMEKDDEGTIEELNNKLLGIQTAGYNDTINKAKNQGIQNILSNSQNASNNSQNQNSSNNNNNREGLNMSFDTNNNNSNNNTQMNQTGGYLSYNSNSNNNNSNNNYNNNYNNNNNNNNNNRNQNFNNQYNQNNNSSNNNNNNQNGGNLSFNTNNNIKTIEIDSSVNGGFIYGDNKNLDPFKM